MICPPQYYTLNEFSDLVDEMEDNRPAEIFFRRAMVRKMPFLATYQDCINLYVAEFLAHKLFVTDGIDKTSRLSSRFFDATFNVRFRYSSEIHKEMRASQPEICEQFNLGFGVERQLRKRLQSRVSASEVFCDMVLDTPPYTTHMGQVVSKHPKEDELDAVTINHFFYQDGSLSPWIFWNKTTNRIDYRLYEFSKQIEATHNISILDQSCELWADILRPFEGSFLCLPQAMFEKSGLIDDFVLSIVKASPEQLKMGKTKRLGRRPTGAKEEFYRRYPIEKPKEVSFDSISAELGDAGFPISARQLQNYEAERNNSSDIVS